MGTIIPCQMAEVRVHGGTDNFAVDFPKFLCGIAEGDDLGRAHKSKIQRVEEENDILS